jgi:hypothetical protein
MNRRWIDPTRRAAGRGVGVAIAASLPACMSMSVGTGSGSLSPGDTPACVDWAGHNGGNTGTMSVTFGGGAVFSGSFAQLTSVARTDLPESVGSEWRHSWSDSGPYPTSAFARVYSGRVIADLEGPDAQQLRGRFSLNDPVAGMRGGGQGECHLSSGRKVQAMFPHT